MRRLFEFLSRINRAINCSVLFVRCEVLGVRKPESRIKHVSVVQKLSRCGIERGRGAAKRFAKEKKSSPSTQKEREVFSHRPYCREETICQRPFRERRPPPKVSSVINSRESKGCANKVISIGSKFNAVVNMFVQRAFLLVWRVIKMFNANSQHKKCVNNERYLSNRWGSVRQWCHSGINFGVLVKNRGVLVDIWRAVIGNRNPGL